MASMHSVRLLDYHETKKQQMSTQEERNTHSMILALFKMFSCLLLIIDLSRIFLIARAASKYFSSLTRPSIFSTNSASDSIPNLVSISMVKEYFDRSYSIHFSFIVICRLFLIDFVSTKLVTTTFQAMKKIFRSLVNP